VFARLASGNVLSMNYEVIGYLYTKKYYLADGIYREWTIFMKTSHDPKEEKYKRFAKE
jgi:hypothetical protein